MVRSGVKDGRWRTPTPLPTAARLRAITVTPGRGSSYIMAVRRAWEDGLTEGGGRECMCGERGVDGGPTRKVGGDGEGGGGVACGETNKKLPATERRKTKRIKSGSQAKLKAFLPATDGEKYKMNQKRLPGKTKWVDKKKRIY